MKIYITTDTHFGHKKLIEWGRPEDFEDKIVNGFKQIELERLQTLPDGYTKILTRNKAAGCIGDGWTVDVIAHILSFIPKQ